MSSQSRPAPPGLLHSLEIEWDADLRGGDPLAWPGYTETLTTLPKGDSVVTGRALANGPHGESRYVVMAGRFAVLGGSMGAVHGERVVRAYRRATLERLPVVILVTSGGARLQEGMVALTQLARTSGAARAHARAGLLSIAVLRPPTTGGVFASYASLADIRAAEPGATVAFAGPRVTEVVTGRPVPASSHVAEAAYSAGVVDALVAAEDQRDWVEAALGVRDNRLPRRPLAMSSPPADTGDSAAWQRVTQARARSRPTGLDHAARICDSWVELRGSDPTMRAGLARIGPHRVVVVAHDRYAALGRQGPGAFRLAQRAMTLAGRLKLPLLSFVDTRGADPGPSSEAEDIAGEIARTFACFAEATVPTVAVCVGEGGSGGALATAACDTVLMLERSIFSVIGPEGAAAIMARDPSQAADYADLLKLTAEDLLGLGLADAVVPEDDPATIDKTIVTALERATVGDRHRRLDAASARWIR